MSSTRASERDAKVRQRAVLLEKRAGLGGLSARLLEGVLPLEGRDARDRVAQERERGRVTLERTDAGPETTLVVGEELADVPLETAHVDLLVRPERRRRREKPPDGDRGEDPAHV